MVYQPYDLNSTYSSRWGRRLRLVGPPSVIGGGMNQVNVGDVVATWRGSGRVVALMLRWRGHLPVPGFVTLVPPVPAFWAHFHGS